MVKRIARIKDGLVTNVEAWDDDVVLTPDMVDVSDNPIEEPVGPGYTYDGAMFTPPGPPSDTRTDDEKAVDAILDKTRSNRTAENRARLTDFAAERMRGR
jgi:hypothetical protein